MTGTAALMLMGLAACAPEGSDRGLISEPSFSHAVGEGCSLRTARNLAQSYFNNADRLTAWTLIRTMVEQHAASANNNAGYDVFRLIADARDNGRVAGTPQNGADLTIALINCMAVTVTDLADFRNVLTGALTTDAGAYAVRGGDGDSEDPVITDNGESGTNPDAETTWNDFLNGRALVYGAEVESAFTEEQLGQSYRWGLVYDGGGPNAAEGDDQVVVAFCTQLEDVTIARVGRKPTTGPQAVLGLALDLDWLPCAAIGAQSPTGLLSRVLAMVMPKPLQASALLFGNTGGLAGGFSDFGVVNPGTVVLTWVTQPTTGFTDKWFPVVVSATAANGTPLEHVSITLTVDGNQGTTVVLTVCDDDGTVGEDDDGTECVPAGLTGEDGRAKFLVKINKTGGYTLRATATFSGFDEVYILSNLFNLSKP